MATFEGLLARDIMTQGCSCARANETLVECARRMAELGIGSLPICGADDKLHGMITDRDIVVKCLARGKDPFVTTAGELADDKVVWVFADATPSQVLMQMEEHQVRRVPVLDRGMRLVGIISQGDIARRLDHEHSGELIDAVSQGPPLQHAAHM